MLRVFPVAGDVRFWDDFGQPRAGGRTHQGCDLFAAQGAPVLAVDDGTITAYVDPLGGNALLLFAADGTRYYYAHLDRWVHTGGRTFAGDLLGYVGTTGNARGTAPHLHLEVHPRGGEAIDPFPLLQRAERRSPRRGSGAALALVGVAGVALLATARRS